MASKDNIKNKSFEVAIEPQSLSNDALTKKREQIMAERNKKLQERMAAMAQRRMKRSGPSRSGQQKETLQKFVKEFTVIYDEIEDDIKKQQTHEEFKTLKLRAFKLESYLAENAAILPSYTFEAKNRMITNLKNKINQTQEEIAPKPKFAFSDKYKQQKASPQKPEKEDIKMEDKTEKRNDLIADLLLNHNEIKIENKKLETIYKECGSINGSDICLSNLVNCTISICDHIGALRMNNIKHCEIICGPIASSLHVEYIENSTINAVMKQCRIHYCKDTKFYIHVNSEPVIEYSNNVQFAPYNVRYKELTDNWTAAKVDKNINQWNKVKDFNWFKQQQSPHWSIIPEQERNDVARPVLDDDDDDEL